MAGQSCLNQMRKDALKAELKDAVNQRINQLGPAVDPAMKPLIAIRDVTQEHLAELRARKVREARQAAAIHNNVDPRLAAAQGRGGVNPNKYAALSLLDRDPTGRFNKWLNATDAGRIALAEAYRAGGPILDKFRARYWASAPELLRASVGKEPLREGMDVVELVKAMKGAGTQNAEMRELAGALKRMSDVVIARFREAGGEIGNLEHFVPHDWIGDKMLMVPKDQWVNEMLGNVPDSKTPVLDRGLIKDVHTEQPLNEAQLRTALENTYDTITTDGRNKIEREPGKYRAGRSQYRAQDYSRFLHFTPEGYIHTMPRYMHDDIFGSMLGWYDKMAKETGLMQVMGPTPSLSARYVMDKLLTTASSKAKGEADANTFDHLQKTFTNRVDADRVADPRIAQGFATARQVATILKLGSAAVHSALIGDTMAATLRFAKNGLGPFGYLHDMTTALKNGAVDANVLRDHQLVWDSRYYGMMDHARTYGDLAYANHKVGNATKAMLDASGLEHLVQREQVAFQLNLMRRFTDHADKDAASLPAGHQRLLNEYGITPAQWGIVRGATKDSDLSSGSFKGIDYDKLYGSGDVAQVAAARQFQHMLISETGAAIFASPHLLARASFAGQGRRGTIAGELYRSMFQFGQWPLTAWHNMFGPLLGDDALITKAKYAAGLLVASMASGYLGLQSKQLLAGKSPLPVNDDRTWLAALAQANIGANWGDMATKMLGLSDPFHKGIDLGSVFDLSPLLGSVRDLATNLAIEPIRQGAKQHSVEAGLRTFGRTGLSELMHDFGAPFGLQLWQTKLAFERLVVQNVENMADPVGYQQRQARANQALRQRGQSYIWVPPS